MSDERNDTTPLGKSVEEVEGESQLQHPDDQGLLGRLVDPHPAEVRDTNDAPTSVMTSLEHSLGMGYEPAKNPDADVDSSEES